MKSALAVLVGALFVSIASAQTGGTLHFGNTASTLITTNNGFNSGPMSGVNAYGLTLYVGPFGTPREGLIPIITATNLAGFPGRFDRGNIAVPLSLPGTTIAFQVRGWALSGALSYEQAIASGNGTPVGESALGFVTLGGGVSPVPEIFGTAPGQVGGFVIGIPEPATYTLMALGLLLLCVFRQRRPFKSRAVSGPDFVPRAIPTARL